MTFEFLIACRVASDSDLRQLIIDLLHRVLVDNLNEFEKEAVAQMVLLRHTRDGHQLVDESGNDIQHKLLGFAVDLPDETASAQTVIDDFAAALSETAPIFHAVKFEDPLLHAELGERATEIYALEMKLRRVLSLIYLHAYQDGDPYDLLCDETVQPYPKEKVQCEQMQAASENQFFHLNFGQYISLNQRQDIKLPALIEILETAKDYETFRAEILRVPVEHEEDVVLLAGLKERMDAIERMRNCVAHNRHPSSKMTENYLNSLPLIDAMLDQYMMKWEVP